MGILGDALRPGVFTALAGVRDKRRKRRLEDLLEERTRNDLEAGKERQALDRVTTDARLRDLGYVAETEREPVMSGKSLDQILNAATGTFTTHGTQDVHDPERYESSVGGYKYDNLSPAARERKARATRAERLASSSDDGEVSYAERKDQRMQARIQELVQGGMSLEKANRQARTEAGQSVSSLEDRINSNAEPANVRNARRGAQHNANLYNTTQSEMARLKRELGNYPDETDPRIKEIRSRLRDLQTRADSIGGVRDSLSAVFTQAISGAPAPSRSTGGATRGLPTPDMDSELAEARRAYDAALRAGADSGQAKQLYEKVARAIRAKYGVPR